MATKQHPKFTEDELKKIGWAAQGVWQEIGCDILQAIGEDNGKGEGATVSRADVIELVMDASRLEGQLKRDKVDPALIARVEDDIYSKTPGDAVAKHLKTVFTYGRYGF